MPAGKLNKNVKRKRREFGRGESKADREHKERMFALKAERFAKSQAEEANQDRNPSGNSGIRKGSFS